MAEITGIVNGKQLTIERNSGKIDPYAVFKMHFLAIGGEDKAKSNKSVYLKGSVSVNSVEYEYEEWRDKPSKSRKIYSQYSSKIYQTGDDGETLWVVDKGKLNTLDDKDTPERKIKTMMENYDYTAANNGIIKVSSSRKVSIDSKKYYEITLKNTKTNEIRHQYFDTSTYLLKREVKDIDGSKTQIDYDDYRKVNGLMFAFKKTVYYSDNDSKEVFNFNTITRGMYISQTKFQVPETKTTTDKSVSASTASGTGSIIDTYA
ncbi:MAG TPA: hypothetical protein PKJ08_08025 [Candidatus Cloacimonadota bacterium]|nr:hypothetical protein [Candidatus Cloacimonadota bacterium]